MTKMSPSRKLKKKLGVSNLTPEESLELNEMLRLVNSRKFEAAQVKANTALIPDGQKLGEQLEAVAIVLENIQRQWVAQHLLAHGWEDGTKCNINLNTGEITLQ